MHSPSARPRPETASWGALVVTPFLWAALAVPAGPEGEPAVDELESDETSDAGVVRTIDRGEDFLPIYVPAGEELVFEVDVQITIFETAVADCRMTTSIEEYRPPLLLGAGSDGGPQGDTTVLSLHAKGDHLLYSMDALMETRMLPQDWPATVHRFVQKGSENRRRETLLGTRDGEPSASYRRDTSRGAPRGTRIWVDPLQRDVPAGCVDMVTGIYLVRTLIRDEHERLTFPMIDKKRVWEVTLRRGRNKVVKTKAGRFRAVEVLLETRAAAGEPQDDDEKFSGPFGLEGAIHLWVDSATGVPVLIQGDLPAGVLTLGVDIRLKSFAGTPPDFGPVETNDG